MDLKADKLKKSRIAAQILIVDDDKESLQRLKGILSGFAEVYLAESGKKALQEMKGCLPDLLMIGNSVS